MTPTGRFQTLRQWKDTQWKDDPELSDLVDELEAEEDREKERSDDGFPEHDCFDEESEP